MNRSSLRTDSQRRAFDLLYGIRRTGSRIFEELDENKEDSIVDRISLNDSTEPIEPRINPKNPDCAS